MMAVLLKHHDLGHVALGLVDHGLVDSGHVHGIPRSIAEVCKVVHHSKRTLIKVGPSGSTSCKGHSHILWNAFHTVRKHFLFDHNAEVFLKIRKLRIVSSIRKTGYLHSGP